MRLWSISLATVLLVLFNTEHCLAQRPLAELYYVHFASAVTPAQEKFIHEAVRSQDPDPVLVIERTAQRAFVNTVVHLDRAQLQAEVQVGGLVIDRFERIGDEALAERAVAAGLEMEAPELNNTGDPVQDNARYDLLKRVYLATRPSPLPNAGIK